jgi:Fic family protein
MAHITIHQQIATREAAYIWGTSDRTARTRLRKLVDQGQLAEIGTGPRDPKKVYVLKKT